METVNAYLGLKKMYDRILDDILDGKPVWIVDSPELREALRRRLRER